MIRGLLMASMPLVFGAAQVLAKSELETLRALSAEQNRQIHQLEEEITKLRLQNEELVKNAGGKGSGTTTVNPEATAAEPAKPAAGASPRTTPGKDGETTQKSNPTASSSPAATTSTPPKATPVNSPPRTYLVKGGETLASISRKTGVSQATLVANNPNIKFASLHAGQIIKLGKTATAQPATTPASTPPAPSPASTGKTRPETDPPTSTAKEPKKSAAAPVGSTSTGKPSIRAVTIDKKITYGEFAAKHGTTVQRLNELNALDLVESTVLAIGSELYIPAQP